MSPDAMCERVVRLTYFEGNSVPMVEIWTWTGETSNWIKIYDYLRTGHVPVCETQGEWLELLAHAKSSLLLGIDPLSVAATSWSPDAQP